MPFQFLDNPEKPLTKGTKAVQKSQLNKLTTQGYMTREDLIAHDKDVVKYIQTLGFDKVKLRLILFAIFQILSETEYVKSENPYQNYFQTLKDDSDPTKKK